VAEALVRLRGGTKSRVLAHRPEPASVHRGLDASCEGELAWIAKVGSWLPAGEIARNTKRISHIGLREQQHTNCALYAIPVAKPTLIAGEKMAAVRIGLTPNVRNK